MLFSSLCLQIFIFYFGIYKIFLARPVKVTYIKTKRCLHPRGLEKPEINYTDQSTPSVCTCIGIYMVKHTRGASVRVKTLVAQILESSVWRLTTLQVKRPRIARKLLLIFVRMNLALMLKRTRLTELTLLAGLMVIKRGHSLLNSNPISRRSKL